jgi:hypothetical protein
MNQIHFLTHSDPLQSIETLNFLHQVSSEHPHFIWLLDKEKTAKEIYVWLWAQENWMVCDLLLNYNGGIALCWPTLQLPSNLPILNHSAISIDTLPNMPKYELVTVQNMEEMRQRYLYYKKKDIALKVSRR